MIVTNYNFFIVIYSIATTFSHKVVVLTGIVNFKHLKRLKKSIYSFANIPVSLSIVQNSTKLYYCYEICA